MFSAKWFPVLLITIDGVASVAYLFEGDVRRSIYWMAAAILTACVTF